MKTTERAALTNKGSDNLAAETICAVRAAACKTAETCGEPQSRRLYDLADAMEEMTSGQVLVAMLALRDALEPLGLPNPSARP